MQLGVVQGALEGASPRGQCLLPRGMGSSSVAVTSDRKGSGGTTVQKFRNKGLGVLVTCHLLGF